MANKKVLLNEQEWKDAMRFLDEMYAVGRFNMHSSVPLIKDFFKQKGVRCTDGIAKSILSEWMKENLC